MENKKIEDFSVNELKAIAYDNLLTLEQAKATIQTIQIELNKRQSEPKVVSEENATCKDNTDDKQS